MREEVALKINLPESRVQVSPKLAIYSNKYLLYAGYAVINEGGGIINVQRNLCIFNDK